MGINYFNPQQGGDGLPVGAVIAAGVSNASLTSDYLSCSNPKLLLKSEYPDLQEAIGIQPWYPDLTKVSLQAFGSLSTFDVVYGNSKYVAIAGGGQVGTSADGITWTSQGSPLSSAPSNTLSFCNGYFWATGGANSFYSADGITWTTVTSMSLRHVVYSSGAYFSNHHSGSNVYIKASTDRDTWNIVATVSLSANPIYRYSNLLVPTSGKIVYLQSHGGVTETFTAVSYSNTGATLSAQNLNVTDLANVGDYLDDLYISWGDRGAPVAGTYWIFSRKVTDDANYRVHKATGVESGSSSTWTRVTPTSWIASSSGPKSITKWVHYSTDGIAAICPATNSVYLTDDGSTGTVISATDLTGVSTNATNFVVTDSTGAIKYTNTTTDLTTNIVSVSPFTVTTAYDCYAVASDGVSKVVAVAGLTSTYYHSQDGGSTWTSSATLATAGRCLGFGAGNFVVNNSTSPFLHYSADGITWTSCTGTLPSAAVVGYFLWTGSALLFSTTQGLFRSTNGIAWTQVNAVSGTYLCSIGAKVVRVLASGQVALSSDHGAAWGVVSIMDYFGAPAGAIEFANVFNGQFIATLSSGSAMYYSDDGVSWSSRFKSASLKPRWAAQGVLFDTSYLSSDGVDIFSGYSKLPTINARNAVCGIGDTVFIAVSGGLQKGNLLGYDPSTHVAFRTTTAGSGSHMKVR